MFVLLAFLAVFACLPQEVRPYPSHEQVQSTTPQETSAKAREKQQPETVIKKENVQTESAHSETQDKKNSDGQPHFSPDTISAYSTLVIAFFTLITTVAFLYQIRIARNAERAWIGLENRAPPQELAWIQFPSVGLQTFNFEFSFVNRGRTHARINFVRVRFRIINKIEELPQTPEYGMGHHTIFQETPPDGIVYPPQEGFVVSAIFEGPGGEAVPTSEQITAVRNHQAILVCYGNILYKDAFRRKHETRFCYVYTVEVKKNGQVDGAFVLGGPSAYNKAT